MSIRIVDNISIASWAYLIENIHLGDVEMEFDTLINLTHNEYVNPLLNVSNIPLGMPIREQEYKFQMTLENLGRYMHQLTQKNHSILIICRFGNTFAPLLMLYYLTTYLYMSRHQAMNLIKSECEKQKIYVSWDLAHLIN